MRIIVNLINYCQFDSLHFIIINLVVVIFNFKSVFPNELMVKIKLLQIEDNINQIDNNRERERERESKCTGNCLEGLPQSKCSLPTNQRVIFQ